MLCADAGADVIEDTTGCARRTASLSQEEAGTNERLTQADEAIPEFSGLLPGIP